MMSIQNKIFDQLLSIIPDLQTRNKAGKSKLESQSMMDLNLDILYREDSTMMIALSHYYKHDSGDLISDPDVVLLVNFDNKTATARTFQDIFGYQDVMSGGVINTKLEQSLNEFVVMWMENNISYGHQIN
jgi:hypothetical protein